MRRWLANARMPVVPTWQPLLRAFLSLHGQRELLLVFDPTPYSDRATLLVLGPVVHKRVLPVAWHIVPGRTGWPHGTWPYLARLCTRVAAALPAETTVTVVVDRGLANVELIDLCQRLGWHYVMRLSVDARQGVHVRLADGTVTPAWAVVPGAAQHWNGAVAVFKHHGWRSAQLTIIWPRRYAQPWLLLPDRPAGRARVHEYRRRVQVEALYEDCKARGWDLEASKLRNFNRLNRLLLALVLALWWCHLLGQQVIRRGLRCQFDRPNRRDLSVLRLGRRWMDWLLDRGRLPPLPFRYHAQHWSCRWLY
ncbi:hypothetical protein BH24CHL1_BH24CHL1_02590 [soil metagenome]